MKESKVGYIENLIEFETAPRPLVTKSNFPYGKIINSLRALDSSKSLVFDRDKLPPNRVTTLRSLAKKEGLGYVVQCKKDEKVHVWIRGTMNGGENGKVL